MSTVYQLSQLATLLYTFLALITQTKYAESRYWTQLLDLHSDILQRSRATAHVRNAFYSLEDEDDSMHKVITGMVSGCYNYFRFQRSGELVS